MSYLIFSALLVLVLCSRGSGTLCAAVSLMLVLLLIGFYRLPVLGLSAAMLLVFSGPFSAMLATPFLAPLFTTGIPGSLRALLISAGYLLVLESPHTWTFLHALSSPGSTVSVTGLLMLCGDIVMSAMLIAGLALTFVALVELPFAWMFRGRRSQSISWLSGMRPVLLVFFVGLSLSQVAGYFTDLLIQAPGRVISSGPEK